VGHGFVLSCKTKEGESLKAGACGSFVGLDAVAVPRLKKLEKCSGAEGVAGKLAVVLTVDFDASHIAVDQGKATTIAQPDPLMACVKSSFQGVALGGVDHEHPRYSVLYTVTLATPASAAAAASDTSAAAKDAEGGVAQVTWPTALVRDQPRTGQIIARLPRGTKVSLGASQDNWYKIKFGPDMTTDGYVYRGAIGK
jgi:hypothetical protein